MLCGTLQLGDVGIRLPFLLLLVAVACESRPGVSDSSHGGDIRDPGRSTTQYLDDEGLAERFREDPEDVLRAIEAALVRDGDRSLAFYLTELAYHAAEQEKAADADAPTLHLSCAAYAYAYLFDEKLGPPPADTRLASEYYNRAVGHVATWIHANRALRDGEARLATVSGEVAVRVGARRLGWRPQVHDRFLVAYDYDVAGLDTVARSDGIGVPCIAVHEPMKPSERRPDDFGPDVRFSYAITVLLRFEGSIRDPGPRRASAEMYDPLQQSVVRIGRHDVPLTVDLTTPLAYTLDSLPVRDRISVEWDNRTGLAMFQPYQFGRIPIVFVHGLRSSPPTFGPLLNALFADKELRKRYQFWFFHYPSGNPVLYSASVLRRQLREAYRHYGSDPAFSEMIVCAHSMGGLVARMLLHDSGDRLWRKVTTVSIDELDVPGADRAALRDVLFFERLPFIKRAIFMSVPHRGAPLADTAVGRAASNILGLPAHLDHVRASFVVEFERRGIEAPDWRIDGVGNLSPKHPLIREVARWSFPDDLRIHSIIGNEDGTAAGGTDGLVPYSSSHLDDVESELVVRSGHSVHKTAAGIREVKRILR